MSNRAIQIEDERIPARMSDAQRRCILHVLRNSAAALEGLSLLLEQQESEPTTQEMHGCIRGVVRALSNMEQSFIQGSYCPLREEDCSYVARWVGCCGSPSRKTSG